MRVWHPAGVISESRLNLLSVGNRSSLLQLNNVKLIVESTIIIIIINLLRSIVTTLDEGLLLTTILLYRYQNRFPRFFRHPQVSRLLVKS